MKAILFLLLAVTGVQAQTNYAVRLWRDEPTNALERVLGVPLDYPAVAKEIGASTNLPPGQWRLMTGAEFAEQRATHQSAFDEWKPILLAAQEAQRQALDAARQMNLIALRNLFEAFEAYELLVSTGTPSNAQVALEVRRLNGAMLQLRPVLRDLYQGE